MALHSSQSVKTAPVLFYTWRLLALFPSLMLTAKRLCLALGLVAFLTCPAFAEQAKMSDSFVASIGVGLHMGNPGNYTALYNTYAPELVNAGIRNIRDNVTSQSNATNYFIPLINNFKAANGVDLKFVLTQWPPAGVNLEQYLTWGIPPANIFAFEGQNESTGPAVIAGQQTIWNQVKNTPNLSGFKVIGPSIAHQGGQDPNQNAGAYNYADYANIHYYCVANAPSCVFGTILNDLAPMNGSKPFITTETGYTYVTVTDTQATKYFSRLIEWFNFGALKTYIYELLDDTNATGSEAAFGLLRADGSPKPAFNLSPRSDAAW